MKTRLPALLIVFALTPACSHSDGGSQPTAPALITATDAEAASQQKAAEAMLAKHKISYNADLSMYQTDKDELISPCDKDFLDDLHDAKALTGMVQDRLKKNDDLYREDALNFSRRVSASDASLGEIVKRVQDYCTKEGAQQSACFGSRGQVLVKINEHIANTPILHPYLHLQIDAKKDLTVYRIYRPIDPFISSVGETPGGGATDEKIAELVTPEDVRQMNLCLQSAIQTEIATDVALTWQTLATQMTVQCEGQQRGWIQHGARSSSAALNAYCGLASSHP